LIRAITPHCHRRRLRFFQISILCAAAAETGAKDLPLFSRTPPAVQLTPIPRTSDFRGRIGMATKKAPKKKSPGEARSGTRISAKKSSPGKKSSGRKYSPSAGKNVETEMREMKKGKLKSGRSGKKVTNPKQAIAIGLSEARREGKKVPPKKK
jgi:hypothetical protein